MSFYLKKKHIINKAFSLFFEAVGFEMFDENGMMKMENFSGIGLAG